MSSIVRPGTVGSTLRAARTSRSSAQDEHRDVLSFETGLYGFQADVADLTRVRLGRLDDGMSAIDHLT